MIIRSLFTATLFSLTSVLADAKDYYLPEIAGAISLSDVWVSVKPDIVQAHNDDMLSRRPQSRLRFIAGFARGIGSNDFYSSTDYLWIQRTPPTKSDVTPEQIVSMIPKVAAKNKAEFERLLKDKIASIDSGAAHYEERLSAIVWDLTDTLPDGRLVPMRCHLIVTKACWISINVYSTPANANTVFEEVAGIVSTLKIKKDQKMPQSWLERLKQLLKGRQ